MDDQDYKAFPLRVNRGGALAPNELIGRERDVESLKRTLERQSVLVAAERRIGKTEICKQAMRSFPPNGLCLYEDLEAIATTHELAESLLRLTLSHQGAAKQFGSGVRKLYAAATGTELTLPEKSGGFKIKLPSALERQWKDVITETIADVVAQQTAGRNAREFVCLMLDEFPVALEKIRAGEGDRTAMDVLDLFRSLRATHGPKLRFVFTGSIGIHHIIRHLKTQKYANEPMNDVFSMHVKALETDAAERLALGLLFGEKVASPDHGAAAAHIARESSRVPFYIHHIVGALMDDNREATIENIDAAIRVSIASPLDPWQLRNYETRLVRHFPTTRPVALAILDALAVTPKPLDYHALIQRVRLAKFDRKPSDEIIGDTLDLLEQDFYIGRDDDSQAYHFLRPLLARAWRHIRRLPSGATNA